MQQQQQQNIVLLNTALCGNTRGPAESLALLRITFTSTDFRVVLMGNEDRNILMTTECGDMLITLDPETHIVADLEQL